MIEPSDKFGIEIELIGLTRYQAAQVIARYFETRVVATRGHYDTHEVASNVGIWRTVTDGSLMGGIGTEVVSPPMFYRDMETLQAIVRLLKEAGAIINGSCGIHVHVNAQGMTAKAVKNMAKMVYAKEELMFKAFGTLSRRRNYARPMETDFVERLNGIRRPSLDSIKRRWYNTRTDAQATYHARSRYDHSRYHAFNLHALYYRGTIEFRYFNGSLHAGKIKSYIQFCLALRNKAMRANSASSNRRPYDERTAKYDMRTWLLALGMVGDEFKTARHHLLKRLPGDSAYRSGRPQSA